MVVIANLMLGVASVLSMLLNFFLLFIIVGAVLSWFSPDPNNMLVKIINGVVEPVLAPFRERIPNFGGPDISPLAAFAAIELIRYVLVNSLNIYGNRLLSSSAPVTANLDCFPVFDILSLV